ncbi:MAG: hypothetical protein KGJ23_08185 [Euryarchaeota archaeon]|nr:hypothetical protein [Euryarchaeota archaeon]MDE1836580.1 hypothetical protein [Euryarchaeota archaeon]MDE1879225.1 hypothetical protein [Euryarchaeota archaeon]MDE2044550.1 hypothetical protein [Thermoplasmata archaeon]
MGGSPFRLKGVSVASVSSSNGATPSTSPGTLSTEQRMHYLFESLRDVDATAKDLSRQFAGASPATRLLILSKLSGLTSTLQGLTESIDELTATLARSNGIVGLLGVAMQSRGDAENLLAGIRQHLESLSATVKQVVAEAKRQGAVL